MDFSIPEELSHDRGRLAGFLDEHLAPNLSTWYQKGAIPRSLFCAMGKGGWLGFKMEDGLMEKLSALRGAMVSEQIATISPGVAVAVLAQVDLGLLGFWLFGSQKLKERYGISPS